ncbi:MAG: translocation/assembly module TamB domain-containing protein [Desulfosoma sp.]
MRGVLRIVAIVVGALVLFAAALWGAMQSPAVKRWLAHKLSNKLSGPQTTVRIGTITGWIPFEMGISEVEIADGHGAWLRAQDMYLKWRPTQLLQGRVHIQFVSVREARVARGPFSNRSSQDVQEPTPWTLPVLPLPILVDKLFLHQVIFDTPVLGMSLVAALEGFLTYDPKDGIQKVFLKLVANHAQRESFLIVQALLQPKSPRFHGSLIFSEQENGWVATRLALKNFGPLHLQTRLHGDTVANVIDTLWIESLNIESRPFLLSASGGYQPGPAVLKPTSYTLVAKDLEPFGVLAGYPIRGQAEGKGFVEGPVRRLHGELNLRLKNLENPSWRLSNGETRWIWTFTREASHESPQVSLNVHGKAESVTIQGSSLPSLQDVTVETSVRLTHDKKVDMEKILLNLPDLGTMELSGRVDLRQRSANGRITVALPDISYLSLATPRPVEGDGLGQLDFSGTWDNMTVLTNLQGSRLAYGEAFWTDWHVQFSVMGLPQNPKGKITSRALYGKGPWRLDLDFAKEGPRLDLPRIFFRCYDASLKGSLQTHLESYRTSGLLDLTIPRLDIFQPLFPQDLRGSIKGTLSLSEKGDHQAMNGSVTARSLTFADIFIENANLSAQLTSLFPAPQGTMTLTVKKLEKPPLSITQAQAKADGNLERVAFSTHLQGTFHEPFSLKTTGTARVHSSTKEIQLDTFSARTGPVVLLLESPSNLVVDTQGWTLSPTALRVGEGRVVAGAQWNGEKHSVSLKMENLPLELMEPWGGPSLQGRLNGQAFLHGPQNNPQATMTLHIDSLRRPGWPAQESLALKASAWAVSRQLRLEADIFGLGSEPSRVNLTLPMRFQLKPIDLSLFKDEPLSGTLSLAVALERIATLLELEEHKIQGNMQGRLTLDGTLNRPLLGGEVLLTKGRYEHEDFGLHLQDVTALLEGTGNGVRLRELKAFDGKKGFLRGHGQCRLDPGAGFPYQTRLIFEDLSPLHRDDISGNLDGFLSVQGSLRETALEGTVRVRPLRIELPKRLPANVVDLDVIEIPPSPALKSSSARKNSTSSAHGVFLNLTLEFPGMTTVSGWGLDSEWKGALKIVGPSSEPQLTGQLNILRGQLLFLDKRFRLTEGHVIFVGETPPDPVIHVVGETALRDMTASVRLSGRASRPELALESSPQRPQEEILAQILFGRSATTLSPFQAIRLARTLQALSTRGNSHFDVLGKARDLLGLDQLELLGSGLGESLGIGLRKYLGENVRVDVDQRLEEGDIAVRVEVEITPNITLESQAGTQSRSRAGVFWKYDY